jgi:hypothetical protein
MTYQWTKAKDYADDLVANSIRRDVRRYRREYGRAGHRFRFATLKNLWYVDMVHAVLSHSDDPVWQHWYNDGKEGWKLVAWYGTRREAQAAAERPIATPEDRPTSTESGLFILAGWGSHYSMRVRCRPETIADIGAVFAALGCRTKSLDSQCQDLIFGSSSTGET